MGVTGRLIGLESSDEAPGEGSGASVSWVPCLWRAGTGIWPDCSACVLRVPTTCTPVSFLVSQLWKNTNKEVGPF